MSGFQTHMLIGGVAGLALGRALDLFGIAPTLGLDMAMTQQLGRSGTGWVSLVSTGLPLIALSALLATVPDIDEPGSFIARRAHAVVTLTGVGLAAFTAYAANLPPTAWMIAAVIGAMLGAIAGHALLQFIRRAAGGHRRFTHSLVLAGALVLAAGGLWLAHLGPWAFIPGALAWGVVIHNLGDVVTISGVPLLYPFSRQSFRILPESVSRFGEPIAALAASVVGLLLLGVLHI